MSPRQSRFFHSVYPFFFMVAAGFILSPVAFGQITVPEFFHIDGSRLPGSTSPLAEGYQIQPGDFSAWGVSITMGDGLGGFPIVARRGAPLLAFTGQNGSDDPLSPGSVSETAITDPVGAGGNVTIFRPIHLAFSPPVKALRIDMTRVPATGSAQDGASAVFSCLGTDGNTGFGGNQNPRFRDRWRGLRNAVWDSLTSSADLTQPAVGNIGYAVGVIMGYRGPSSAQAAKTGPFIRVAQESSPGAGDFDQHVLGLVRPIRSPASVAPLASEVYAYERSITTNNNSYGGFNAEFGLAPMQSTFFFADTTDGLGLFVVHHNGSGGAPAGAASLQVAFSGFSGSLVVPVVDDPGDGVALDVSNRLLTADEDWDASFTDGFAVCGMNGTWQALASFQSFNSGLTSWGVFSTDGAMIRPVLAVGRRVQFMAVNNCLIADSPIGATLCSGGSVLLTTHGWSTDAGGTVTYQWRRNSQNIVNGGHFANATTASLSISNAAAVDSGSYDCVVTNGCGPVTTTAASVMIFTRGSGDGNGDGRVDGNDIRGFVNALISGGANPSCAYDMNLNGVVNSADMPGFVTKLLN